jgi:hypothetical protein
MNLPINVFLDTSIVNNLLDIDKKESGDLTWEKNKRFTKLLIDNPVALGHMILYVNPSVKSQIGNTDDVKRKEELINKFNEFRFEECNFTIFPFTFPASFITQEQSDVIEDICKRYPNLEKDRKIIADSAFNDKINFLLTTDRKLAHQVCRVSKVRFMLPEELWDWYTHYKG